MGFRFSQIATLWVEICYTSEYYVLFATIGANEMKPYQPCKLPLKKLDYSQLLPLVGEANRVLARYDGLLQGIVNPDILLSPLTIEEATFSSRLEGTQATVDDVYEHEAGIRKSPEQINDIQEISNYRKALRLGQQHLEAYPISLPFIRELHRCLLDSVRGKDKSPGEFRVEQNWIGPIGCGIEQATFVPPSPYDVPHALEAWQHYLSGSDLDVLIQTAIMHAQFELIHPFKDGNGRIGRLLIPLFLYQKKVLAKPMFYLSSYFETHRDTYYATLNAISKEKDWNSWILYFLKAIAEQAAINSEKVNAVKALYETLKRNIHAYTHSQFAVQALDQIFKRPIFKISDFAEESAIPKRTASEIIRNLKEKAILKTLNENIGNQPAVFCFPQLLNVAEGKTVF